jgi:FkbM family methyltransferase
MSTVLVQRVLLKLYTAGVLPPPARAFVRNRSWTVECGEARGLTIAFPQNLDYVRGSTEPPIQKCIARYLASGGVFYDIGANVGFFSLLAARRVGPQGFVYAFEPLADNVAAIRRNVRLNGFANVTVHQVAVDARSGEGELLLTAWDGGSSLATAAGAPAQPLQRHTVRVVALDDLIQQEGLRPPTLVKIDVEGVEGGVLAGMVKALAAFRPVLVYEVDDRDAHSFERRWKELDQFVSGFGYRVTHLESSYPNLRWHVGHSLAVPSEEYRQ